MIALPLGIARLEGDGDPGCPVCHGRGGMEMPPERRPVGVITPVFEPCRCVIRRARLQNMDKAWPGLSAVPPIAKASQLSGLLGSNAWITAATDRLRAHMHRVALGQPHVWHFKVSSDADVMTSWLGSLAVKGMEVFDIDAQVSTKHVTIVDLVEPPSLLVLQLGVKTARNAAMPEVLLEAVRHRVHVGKPTWVIDQPAMPLGFGHLAYSQALLDVLSEPSWTRVVLGGTSVATGALPITPLGSPALAPPKMPDPDPVDEAMAQPVTQDLLAKAASKKSKRLARGSRQ